MKRFISISATLLTLSAAIFAFSSGSGRESIKAPPPLASWMLEGEKNTIDVFENSAPLVVFVHNFAFRQNMFSFRVTEVQQGTGSGFIWDDQGHIVTNFHVIRNAEKLAVTLKNGSILEAKVIGVEPRKDLAVLKVNPKHLPKSGFIEKTAKSAELRVGQKTLAIGNPFGLDHTLTVGTVSALNRSFETFYNVTIRDMIQTDAAINPGNSGGPLLDSRGYLIGMNTAIFSNSGSSAGIGFAVPSDTIKRFTTQIIKHGKVILPGLGIAPMDPRTSRYLEVQSGVLIESVVEDSGADKPARRGTYMERYGRRRKVVVPDIIVGIENDDIDSYDDIYNSLIKRKVGDNVTVRYLRKGKEKTAKIKLSEVGK